MNVTSLSLRNYRNVSDLDLSFPETAVGFVGENGQGKTNILESLYILSTGDRWRGDTDADLIRFGCEFARIEASGISADDSLLALLIEQDPHTHRTRKKYLVNGISRTRETFAHYYAAVLFHPEDIQVVNGTPSSRRALLDACIGDAIPYYRKVLSQYSKLVISRNRLLDRIREGLAQENQLEYWTDAMIRVGSEVYSYRYSFFSFLQQHLSEYSIMYSPNVVLDGDTSVELIERAYAERIQGNLPKEIASATSQYGPHKDDYSFFLGDRDIGRYGSRGEQRAALFSFKKAHVLYIEKNKHVRPVLLLDDVFSEFDSEHRAKLAELCRSYQTFVTGTELSYFSHEHFHFDALYSVSEGQVIKI